VKLVLLKLLRLAGKERVEALVFALKGTRHVLAQHHVRARVECLEEDVHVRIYPGLARLLGGVRHLEFRLPLRQHLIVHHGIGYNVVVVVTHTEGGVEIRVAHPLNLVEVDARGRQVLAHLSLPAL